MTPREQLARRVANDLIDEIGVTTYPVDVEWIVRQKHLMFEERSLPPTVYGALFRSGNTFGVIVSTACPGIGHRRFTIGHELGHYHMPDHIERLFPQGVELALSLGGHYRSRKDPVEVEADSFSSELLMPTRLIGPFLRSIGRGLAAVRAIAEAFRVSIIAAAIRYAELAGEPTIVIVSHNGEIEWAARSPAIWAHDWARRTLKKDWAPPGSATRRLARDHERVRRGEYEDGSMLLCEWFDGAPGDLEVEEEAIGLGSYGRVLTVLVALGLPDCDERDDESEERDDPRDWRDALRSYRLG